MRTPTTTDVGRRSLRLVASALVVSAVVATTSIGLASATGTAPHASSAATTFCARLPIASIAAIEAQSVTLEEATVKGHIIACVYQGALTSSIEVQSDLPSSSTSTLAGAEAATKATFPATVRLTFTAVASVGPTAFDWVARDGSYVYSGLNTYVKSTVYAVELAGALQLPKLKNCSRSS